MDDKQRAPQSLNTPSDSGRLQLQHDALETVGERSLAIGQRTAPLAWLAVCVLLLSACSSSSMPFGDVTTVPSNRQMAYHLKRSGPSSKLVVTRTRDYLRSGCYYAVYINETLAARMEPGERAEFYVPAGKVSYGVGPDPYGRPICRDDSDEPDHQRSTLQAGETRQLRLNVNLDGTAELLDGLQRSEIAERAEQTATPAIAVSLPQQGRLSEFTMAGSTVEKTLRGDLNGDQIADAVLILHHKDPAKVIRSHDGGGPDDTIDTNPRVLVGLLADGNGPTFSLLFQAPELIPRRDTPGVAEPLGAIQIDSNTLSVGLHFRPKTGSGPWSETTFRFKLDGKCMRLVNYEDVETQRDTNASSGMSVNYIDGAIETIKSKPGSKSGFKMRRTRMSKPPRLCIEDVGNGWGFDPKATASGLP